MAENQVATTQKKELTIWQKLDSVVSNVISQNALIGFEKAHIVAVAHGQLQEMLTPEYMKPIMALQGSSLGFKTDRENYDEKTVKKCLIEATLWGVQPVGNQFNIIAGNAYITKEGYGYLLAHFSGLSYSIVPDLPRINADSTSAAITMNITWSLSGGETRTQALPIPVKMNKMMGTDAVIGKATRKARKWLFDTISGSETPDGDVTEIDAKSIIIKPDVDKTAERIEMMVNDCETPDQLTNLKKEVDPKYHNLFTAKEAELKK